MSWFVVILALVAGCGGSSEPRTVQPVPSVSPSPSPSPSLTPEEQVLAAVRAYYAAVNYAAETGDTSRVLATTTPECSCRSVASYIDGLQAKGQGLRNARNELGGLRVTQVTASFAVVAVNYLSPRHQVVDLKSGRILETFPSKRFVAQVTVKAVASNWLVALEREVS